MDKIPERLPDLENIELPEKKPPSAIQLIQDFTDKLTLHRIFTALLAGLFALTLYTAYEGRDKAFGMLLGKIMTSAETPKNWEVSAETKTELVALLKHESNVRFVLLTAVDLQKNRRTHKFWHLQQGMTTEPIELLPQAAFDYDQKNTQQMVAVLNNEFVCVKYADTFFARAMPLLGTETTLICRMAVPPFYGRFVGVLTFGLKTEPAKEELDALRIEASRLAVQIYLHDVIKRSV